MVFSTSNLNPMDPTQHPKFNPITGKVETRGRKRKATPEAIHHQTQAARDRASPKLIKILEQITEEFGNMTHFLSAWTTNDTCKASRDRFMASGAGGIIAQWLPIINVHNINIEPVVTFVQSHCEKEVTELMRAHNNPLRYSKTANESILNRGMTSSLDIMVEFAKDKGAIIWKICHGLATGMVHKQNSDFVTLSAILNLLNCRNQKINAFQTLMAVFLYSSHISKAALEVLHELGICSSYSHMNEAIKRVAGDLQTQLGEESKNRAMLVDLDNINIVKGMRDGSSTRQSYASNTTGGYATPVMGLPSNAGRFIPREWLTIGGRVSLDSRELRPSKEAVTYMKDY